VEVDCWARSVLMMTCFAINLTQQVIGAIVRYEASSTAELEWL
jgi:hypothetical protein